MSCLRYAPPLPGVPRPPVWPPQPPVSQGWPPSYTFARPGITAPERAPVPVPQPLFPIQGATTVPSAIPGFPQPPPQPLFPIHASVPQVSASMPQPQHALPGPPGAPPGVPSPLVGNSLPLQIGAPGETGHGEGSVQGLTSTLSSTLSSSHVFPGMPFLVNNGVERVRVLVYLLHNSLLPAWRQACNTIWWI